MTDFVFRILANRVLFLTGAKTLQTNHGGECQTQLTLLLRLCDSVAPLVLILCKRLTKANLSGYILVIHNIFVLLNSSSLIDFNLACILL